MCLFQMVLKKLQMISLIALQQREAEDPINLNRPLWTPDPSDEEDWPLAGASSKRAKKGKGAGNKKARNVVICCSQCPAEFDYKLTHDLHVKVEHKELSVKQDPDGDPLTVVCL